MSNNLYAERDIECLDEDGNFYFKHVMAMTAEGLHSKSDIAAELGYRDSKIVELQSRLERAKEERDALSAQVEALQHHINRTYKSYQLNTGNEPSLSVFHRAIDDAMCAAEATPQQHLRDVRAEAVISAANACNKYSGDFCAHSDLIKHAELIRSGSHQ